MEIKDLPEEQKLVAGRLVLKLTGLKLSNRFSHVEPGPVVTTYYFQLGFDVPIAKILNKAEDFALAAGVDSVIIQRSGDKIAIEIPNKQRQIVNFHNCLYSMMTTYIGRSMTIPILLGVDTYGKNAYLDLAEQPHILIAGSTGGGKSILLSSIIGALATAKSEKEIKLTLVDTKRLDLPLFKNLPHVGSMCENSEQFHSRLDYLFTTVRERAERLQGVARNAREFNDMSLSSFMEYHIIIIDELADLMDQDIGRRNVDPEYAVKWPIIPTRLKALTQICRAAGVHIIAATQRSSVKIINGDIKANFPTRIALRLPTAVDSKTILSTKGAESLLGKGDMLVESLDSDTAKRYHGAFVSNQDIITILSSASMIREQLLALPEVMA